MCESVRVLAAKPVNRVPIPGIHEVDAEKGISHKLLSDFLCVTLVHTHTEEK